MDTPVPLAFIRELASVVWESIEDVLSKLSVFWVFLSMFMEVLKPDVFLVLIHYCSDLH